MSHLDAGQVEKMLLKFPPNLIRASKSSVWLSFFAFLLMALVTGNCVSAAPPAATKGKPAVSPAVKPTTKPSGKPAFKPTENPKDDKTAKSTIAPEPVLNNLTSVTPDDLVNKPDEYVGKNVKFNAHFFAFSNLALDYKPAFKSSKTHLSFLILRPSTHIPLSELKLAMMIPKDKDPENALLAGLKDGDQLEIIGKVFSAALADSWVEVFRVKKIGGTSDAKTVASSPDHKNNTEKSDNKDEKSSNDKADTKTK